MKMKKMSLDYSKKYLSNECALKKKAKIPEFLSLRVSDFFVWDVEELTFLIIKNYVISKLKQISKLRWYN